MKRRELQALCKRHGLPASGTNVDLVARLDAALSGPSGAEEEAELVVGVEARKGCLKRSVGDAAEAKKVTFVVEESRGRRLRSRVVWSPVVAKTRGKRAEAGADSAADGSISAEAGANAPVRRSRRNSLTAAEAEEVEEAVTVDRKRKRKAQEIAEDVAVSAQVVVSSRVTRRSSLSGTAVLLLPAVEKKRGRGKAADGKNILVAEEQVPEAQHSSTESPAVVETKKSRRRGEKCEPDVQKHAKVEASSRTTRSHSVEAVVMSPTVVENKRRRKTGDAQPDVELPTVSEVPRNDAPVTRSLRNKAGQVNNSVVEETHTGKQRENKMQPNRPATRRHQQVASCVEEEDQEQLAAPSKGRLLRRSGRNNAEASNANSETDKLSSAPVGAKDSNAKVEDVEKQPIVKEPVRRSSRKSVVSGMLDNEKDLIEEKNPQAHVRRSMRKSIVPVQDIKGAAEEIQTAKGEDAAKQPAVKEPVRRSTRKSIVSAMHEKEEKDLIAEKNPGAHARRLMRKSVVPEIQNAKGEDVEKQLVVKQPLRRSSRKSVQPDALENESGFVVAETNAEAHVRGSKRKSVLPNMLNENQDHSKVARNDNFQIGKCEDEKQQKVKEPVRRSRRSVATVMLGEQNKDLHEGKMPTVPTRRSIQGRVGWEPNTSTSGEKNLADVMSTGLHTKSLQHGTDILAKETGEASGSALPISDSNTKIHCDVIAKESIRAADLGRCPSKGGKGNPLLTNLHSEGAADDSILPVLNAAKECSSDGRHSSCGLEFLFTEGCKESCSRNVENTSVEVDGGNKSSTYVAPGFYVGSDCGLQHEDAQPTGFVPDKKLDEDQDVTEEEVVAEEKSNDEHVAAKTDLKTKLNGELAGLDIEPDCNIAEKNARLVADNPADEEAIIQVQQGDVQEEGDLAKPSQFSATPECKHDCGLPEAVLHSKKDKECLSSAEQSPFGLQSLFSQESIEKSVEYGALASATVHTGNGPDELKDCHVKLALEKTHVPEPFSHHDTDEGGCSISKNEDSICTSQQDNGIEGSVNASLNDEWISTSLLLDAKNGNEANNSEEVPCKGKGSKKLVHPDDLKASSEKADVNEPVDDANAVSDVVLSSALHAPANDKYDACLGSNTELLHQGHKDRFSEDKEEQFASEPWTNDIIEYATAKCIESGVIQLPAKERSHLQDDQLNSESEHAKVMESGLNINKDISSILVDGSAAGIAGERILSASSSPKDSSVESNLQQELLNGSSMETFLDGSATCGGKSVSRVDTIEQSSFTFSLSTPGYKHEGALSEETVRTMKKYAGTCSSNPRELLMDLQSLFSKENIEESDPDDAVASPNAESPGYESIVVEQRVKVHLGSNLSQLESTDLLDELIVCSKTEVLHHGHKDRCSTDREEQVASEPCTNDIAEAAAYKYIESGVVLLPSDERSNLKDGHLNPKQENPIVMGSGLNCNEDVTNTSDSGSVADIIGKRTTSGSLLPEDYHKDHSLQQECSDEISVESSLQGSTISGKKIVSGVADNIGNTSFCVATPDYKHEDALSEEAVHKMNNYTGTCSVDPRHLLMELQSLFSEGSIEKSDSHDHLGCPSAERGRNEPIVCDVEKQVDPLISSEPDTYQSLHQDLSRAEEKESCMSISMQHNESEGFLRSSHMKDSVTSAHIDLSDDVHLTERNIVAEEVLSEEKEKRTFMPASDRDILHEKSLSNEYGVLQQHHKEDCYEHNVDQVASGIYAMSEAAPIEVLENGIALVHAVEKSALPDEQLNTELEVDEVEKYSLNRENEGQITPGAPASGGSEDADIERSEREIGLTPAAGTLALALALEDEQLNTKVEGHKVDENRCCYDKDTSTLFDTGSLNSKESSLHKDTHMDPPSDDNPPNELSAPRSPDESTVLQNYSVPGSESVKAAGEEELTNSVLSCRVSKFPAL